MRILIFGDSIAYGCGDPSGGWPQKLRQHFDEKQAVDESTPQPNIYNLGISGDTTQGVISRLEPEVAARHDDDSPVIVIAIGTNDTIFRGEEVFCTPETYGKLLINLLDRIRPLTDKILFVGMPPVIDEECNPFADSVTGKCFASERIMEFENHLREFCVLNDLPIVKLFEPFKERLAAGELLYSDGLHPNERGQELIADHVMPELRKLIA